MFVTGFIDLVFNNVLYTYLVFLVFKGVSLKYMYVDVLT